jgi:hypothetical protein
LYNREPGIPNKNRAIITIAALKQAWSFGDFAGLTNADTDPAYQDLGANTFPLFPKLPIELRNMIWRASFLPGRRIKVAFKRLGRLYDEKYSHPRTTHPAPVTFHVNKESRAESIRPHESLFGFNTAGIELAPVYFRAAVDTLMISELPVFDLSEGHLERLFPTMRLQNILFLELHNPCWVIKTMYEKALLSHGDDRSGLEEYIDGLDERDWHYDLAKALLHPRSLVMQRFPNLKRLTFVVDEEDMARNYFNAEIQVKRCLKEIRA